MTSTVKETNEVSLTFLWPSIESWIDTWSVDQSDETSEAQHAPHISNRQITYELSRGYRKCPSSCFEYIDKDLRAGGWGVYTVGLVPLNLWETETQSCCHWLINSGSCLSLFLHLSGDMPVSLLLLCLWCFPPLYFTSFLPCQPSCFSLTPSFHNITAFYI